MCPQNWRDGRLTAACGRTEEEGSQVGQRAASAALAAVEEQAQLSVHQLLAHDLRVQRHTYTAACGVASERAGSALARTWPWAFKRCWVRRCSLCKSCSSARHVSYTCSSTTSFRASQRCSCGRAARLSRAHSPAGGTGGALGAAHCIRRVERRARRLLLAPPAAGRPPVTVKLCAVAAWAPACVRTQPTPVAGLRTLGRPRLHPRRRPSALPPRAAWCRPK